MINTETIICYGLLGVFTVIGVVLLCVAYYYSVGILKKYTLVVPAKVLEVHGVTHSMYVVYEANINGKTEVLREQGVTCYPIYVPKEGELVELYANPDDIQQFCLPKRSKSMGKMILWIGIVLLVTSIYGMVMYTIG